MGRPGKVLRALPPAQAEVSSWAGLARSFGGFMEGGANHASNESLASHSTFVVTLVSLFVFQACLHAIV